MEQKERKAPRVLTNVAVSALMFSTSLCRCCQASNGVSCSSDANRSTYQDKKTIVEKQAKVQRGTDGGRV